MVWSGMRSRSTPIRSCSRATPARTAPRRLAVLRLRPGRVGRPWPVPQRGQVLSIGNVRATWGDSPRRYATRSRSAARPASMR
ncbi:hypothetical protein ACFFX0_24295 [Citricoccus parietis]|uniref:Uncharacterized protein n=1 Tax=Citricoccus parietis TaxID=592307 RepID=A0ABV5G5E0_9MICC